MPRVQSDGSLLCVSNTSISGGSNELLNGEQPDVSNELQQSSQVETDLLYENEISPPCESEVLNSRSVCIYLGFLHSVLFFIDSKIDY
jgi:hypothetical protein